MYEVYIYCNYKNPEVSDIQIINFLFLYKILKQKYYKIIIFLMMYDVLLSSPLRFLKYKIYD